MVSNLPCHLRPLRSHLAILVTISRISYSRYASGETWITSDGRAYFVQLLEELDLPPSASDLSATADTSAAQVRPLLFLAKCQTKLFQKNQVRSAHDSRRDSSESIRSQVNLEWRGTCVHDIEVPRWVQKRKHIPADDPEAELHAYHEPRRAKCVAVNTKFSLVATGTHGYASTALKPSLKFNTKADIVVQRDSGIRQPPFSSRRHTQTSNIAYSQSV